MKRSALDLRNRYGWVRPFLWFKWIRQRKRWGFCEADVWDMCSYIPRLIGDMMDYMADHHDAVPVEFLPDRQDGSILDAEWQTADREYSESLHELARNLRYWNDYREFAETMSEKDKEEYGLAWAMFLERLPRLWT